MEEHSIGKVCDVNIKGGGCKSIFIVFKDNSEVYYLNCGDGSMCIHTFKLTRLNTLIMHSFFEYTNYNSKKSW